MPISFHRPLRLLHRHPASSTPVNPANPASTSALPATHPSSSPPSPTTTPSSTRKSPPRRSRPRCLPCVGAPLTPPPPANPPPFRRCGFEHVDAASFPPVHPPPPSPEYRCDCGFDHPRHVFPDHPNHLSTPRQSPLQSTANRPPTPSAHALAGLLPPVGTCADPGIQHLPHTPRPSPSNRPLHVHAANVVSQLPASVATGPAPSPASYDHHPGRGTARMNHATRRRRSEFVSGSQDTAFAAARGRSIQVHDYNNNTVVLVTLGDGAVVSSAATPGSVQSGQPQRTESTRSTSTNTTHTASTSATGNGTGSGGISPAHSESYHGPSSLDDDSAGEVGMPILIVGSDQGSADDNSSEGVRPSDVTDDEQSLEKKLAKEKSTGRELSSDSYKVIMRAMERVLAESTGRSDCLSDIFPDDRTEAHYRLAMFHSTHSKNVSEGFKTAMHHCRQGLFLMQGRERQFPDMATELHILATEILLVPRDPRQVQKVLPAAFKHLSDARVAMYALKKSNQELAFDLSLLTAAAHVLSTEEPICENLLSAYSAYKAAEDMLRMGDFDRGCEWIKLGSHQLQVMLRFLTHKSKMNTEEGSICSRMESAPCRRKPAVNDDLSDLTADIVVTRAEALRFKIIRHFEVKPEDLVGEQRCIVSVMHESVARAYVERAAISQEKGMHDLQKAALNVDKAMGSCAWQDDYAGQKYLGLRELAEEIQGKIRSLKRGKSSGIGQDNDSCGSLSSEMERETGN